MKLLSLEIKNMSRNIIINTVNCAKICLKNTNRSIFFFLTLLFITMKSESAEASKLLNFQHPHLKNSFIIKWKKTISSHHIENLYSSYGLTPLVTFRTNGAQLVANNGSGTLKEKAQVLSLHSAVEYIEANVILSIDSTLFRPSEMRKDVQAKYRQTRLTDKKYREHFSTASINTPTPYLPNDPLFERMYGLHNIGPDNPAENGTEDSDIDAPEAWSYTKGSKDVLVAVIDTGIDFNHPDLKENYWTNLEETGLDQFGRDKRSNGVDDDKNGYVDDYRGWNFIEDHNNPMDDHNHGTHCAGIIGAVSDNEIGITGVSWEVSLVGLKFLDSKGQGTIANAIRAIEYATLIGADITNNSWAGGGFSPTMEAVIRQASQQDILFVAAAGNDGRDNDVFATYPANYELSHVISVAASDATDELALFSNYGKHTVDISAPGVRVLSTIRSEDYSSLSGTSMAAPHVSGAAVLLKAHNPESKFLEIKNQLINRGDPIENGKWPTMSGKRLNLANALETDNIPPGKATDIRTVSATRDSAVIAWQGAGDDLSAGLATSNAV